MLFNCWKCGNKIEYPSASRLLRADTCPQCDSDLHCCRNCQFYDPSKYNQCIETQAEWVRSKEGANCCDYYQPNPVLMACDGAAAGNDVRKKFESLSKV
jgi:hypothetical protein